MDLFEDLLQPIESSDAGIEFSVLKGDFVIAEGTDTE